MTKYILTGFVSSASFLTLLIISQTAQATPLSTPSDTSDILSQTKSTVNLNLSSSYLNMAANSKNPILAHLSGCNCPTCTQPFNPISL
ncbi:MAG TPA: hypothetical protein DCF68_06190 [Cyanothece sp. UBA12306]|nr:hypothetical protein [Cyanothece sp. UBA12306]